MPVDVLKSGSLSSVTVAEMSDVNGGGGGGISDAPDDKQYLRTKGAWGLIGDWAKTGVPGNQTQVDWNAETGVGSIKNKPTIPAAQIQSDWNQTDNTKSDFIKNKPSIGGGISDAQDSKNYVRTKGEWVDTDGKFATLNSNGTVEATGASLTSGEANINIGFDTNKNALVKVSSGPINFTATDIQLNGTTVKYTLTAATNSVIGGVKMAAKVESTGSVADIIKALQDAGIMSK